MDSLLNQWAKRWREKDSIIVTMLIILLVFSVPYFILGFSKIQAVNMTKAHIHLYVYWIVPDGGDPNEFFMQVFKNNSVLERWQYAIVNWPGYGVFSIEKAIDDITRSSYMSLLFMLGMALLYLVPRGAKTSRMLDSIWPRAIIMLENYKVFFQVLTSISFAFALFFTAQAVTVARDLGEDIISYYNMTNASENIVRLKSAIIRNEGWSMAQFLELGFLSSFSGIMLLLAILFGDAIQLSPKARIVFLTMKVSGAISLLYPILLLLFQTRLLV